MESRPGALALSNRMMAVKIYLYIFLLLKGVSRRPVTGDVIYYQIAKDNRGKYKAVNAYIEGVKLLEDTAMGGSNKKGIMDNISNKGVIAIIAGCWLLPRLRLYICYAKECA